eukprot:CAMPEP_0119103764 /NCGR_PEP_ID=MMETSP1180-20130426/2134_1 /TAXON_ID=3052 ORGANISM="Chlamydomonas cf sp, Strain CCMP681" /NCGR_SAMPLE_ID=MMETSP1180 /ASSEMBLY_ACC=CAM_ASM_000741 /LENGTH=160 /DNA_ID=CAMNT_0007088343 /DNA_START=19 /DNA_END=501 /DNA_ORIENTATION=-
MDRNQASETRLYIGNLAPGITERELEDEFGRFGRIRSVWVARKPPGFAFMEFEDIRDAEDAVRKLDNYKGWKVEFSRRGPRMGGGGGPPGGGGGGGGGPPRDGGFGGDRGRSPPRRRASPSPPRRRRSPSYDKGPGFDTERRRSPDERRARSRSPIARRY